MFRTDPKVAQVQSSRLVHTYNLGSSHCIPAVCFLGVLFSRGGHVWNNVFSTYSLSPGSSI